ncbi:MAG: hypothetical protein OXU37_08735 [Thaumarchaeota archaeon]|nr:hypothetical protein [Nitrososphaerota archaeon]MDD9814327.1 hypothetical protein [Nitrososphaerota archaeon]
MTVQCVTYEMWLTTGTARAMQGDPVEAAFSTIHRRVMAVCARAGARPALPVDRELLVTGVLTRLGRRKARRFAPCPNYPRMAAELREHSAGLCASV